MDNYYNDKKMNLVLDTTNKAKTRNTLSVGSKNETGILNLKKGQHVTGTVIRTGNQVTFNVAGHEVSAPEGMYKNALPGDTKEFEVLKVTGGMVELQALDLTDHKKMNAFFAIIKHDADGKMLLSRKEHKEKQAEREKTYQNVKDKMESITSKMTEKDYSELNEEGFRVEDFTVDGLDAALDRIKADKASTVRAGARISSMLANTAANGNLPLVNEEIVKNKLMNADLPVTKASVQRVMTALSLNDSITKLDDKAVKYLVGQELPPTIENLYKAQYSSTQGVYSPISDADWEQLKPQVTQVIKDAGHEVNQENMDRARWLVENQLPLTKESFAYTCELKDMEVPVESNEALDEIIEGMRNRTAPEDVQLLHENGVSYEQIISDIDNISEEAINKAVQSADEITIKILADIQKSQDTEASGYQKEITEKFREQEIANEGQKQKVTETEQQKQIIKADDRQKMADNQMKQDTISDEQQLAAIKAQRQLEEIRLKMTIESAAALEKKGFHVETQSLEKVVEALKDMEASYYTKLLSEVGLEPDAYNLNVLKATSESMEQLKFMPSYILGNTLSNRNIETVPDLLEAGNKLSADFSKANAAYETLMTQPNREYGDSIQKAFKNMDSLLEEMGLQNTQYNQRAVRILGYNHMDITEESINEVKAYDLEVNTLIDNLKPAVTIRLIKEGINPLDIPVNQLNKKIDELKEEQGISDNEKFSTYLQKLDKKSALPQEERNAYIGIYRLLSNIEKTDGAALGAVINSGREVTLNHLLSAVRTLKKGNVNVSVDDDFGALESASHEEKTITQQIEPVFAGKPNHLYNNSTSQEMPAGQEAQAEFLNLALKQLLNETSPEKLKQVQQESSQSSLLNISEEAVPLLSSDRGIWETIKNMPVEALFDKVKFSGNKEADRSGTQEDNLQEIREAYKNSDQAVRFLDDYKVPCTTTNIMLAGQLLSNDNSFFKKLYNLRDEEDEQKSKNHLKKIDELTDTLDNRNTMNEAYAQLESEVGDILSEETQSEKIDSLRLTQLKSISLGMSFIRSLAKKEVYQIPVETKNGITNVNLTIIRGAKETGKVMVSAQSDQLGRIKADLSVKDQTLNGYIACDNRDGIKKLKTGMKELDTVLKEEKITVKNLDLCEQKVENETYSYQNSGEEKENAVENPETERVLYRIAKSILSVIRSAEASE